MNQASTWLPKLALMLLLSGAGGAALACDGGSDGNAGDPGCAAKGNPLNIISGNKFQKETDMAALPGVLGLEVVRYYNSALSGANERPGIIGRGWRLSYDTELWATRDTLQIMRSDGKRFIFNRDPAQPSLCSSGDVADGSVEVRRGPRGEEYVWRQSDGRQLSFDANGKLVQILAPTGEFVSLQRDTRGMLVQVTDPQGRTLRFSYPTRNEGAGSFRGVQHIDTPVGRYSYAYGSSVAAGADQPARLAAIANLVRVGMPGDSGTARLYHYEHNGRPSFLTGISNAARSKDGKEAAQRYATFGYNVDGKAVLSTHAGDVDKITLDFSVGGRTVLTNSLGQKTVYRHTLVGYNFRVLEVRGVGCSLCGEVNVRYGYDKYGRANEIIKLDRDGVPLLAARTEFDAAGRPLKVSRVVYANGKPGAPQWQQRFEYAGSGNLPVLIAQPSVVAGREMQTRISYNDKQQPTSIAMSGWTPALDGKSSPSQIARESRYVYRTINSRSVLVQMDGPLPNGRSGTPADSDIAVMEYDPQANHVTAMHLPGGVRSAMGYDAAGRIISVESEAGRKTSFNYDVNNQLIATVSQGLRHSTLFDAYGNPVEIGYGEGADYRAVARFGYDDAGRKVWAASSLGVLLRHRYDTENHLLEASTESSRLKQSQTYRYDDFGRLVSTEDANGAVRSITWNARDLPGVASDALGRETRYGYDPAGNLRQVVAAANTLQAQLVNTTTTFEHDGQGKLSAVVGANGTATLYVRDDFGRVVMIDSPDSGPTTRSFDAGDHIRSSIDAKGNRAQYEHDLRGRVVRQTITSVAAGGKPIVTEWKYQGPYLASVTHPQQSETYAYDAVGRMVDKTITLHGANGPVRSITRYGYDKFGQLASSSLPDGSTLIYKRNGQDQVIELDRSVVSTPWLRWLLPAKPVASKLERDIVGLKHMEYGNGIEAHFLRSKQGTLARIVYRHPSAPVGDGKTALLEGAMGIAPAHAANAAAPGALFDQNYQWDLQGNLRRTQGLAQSGIFNYDGENRLITTLSVDHNKKTATGSRYFHDGAGNPLLVQADITQGTQKLLYAKGSNRLTSNAYDANGGIAGKGERVYVWDAMGQLSEARQGQRKLASYGYNHRGERVSKTGAAGATLYLYEDRRLVAELNGKGEITRQYVYLADQPIAVIDSASPRAPDAGDASAFGQIMTDLATILRGWFSAGADVSYLHHNHLGAVELITDKGGQPVWRASYAPYGQVHQVSMKNFHFNLRLPGQYEDEETGLYYNDHRYYDPAASRYISADPMGLRAGINGYAYVGNNPLRYIDPSGLILMAFDGTGNSANPPATDSISNVRKFMQAYDTAKNGEMYYITGIGTTNEDMPYEGSMKTGDGFAERVAKGFEFLDKFVDKDQGDGVIDLDVIGFSRGAAEARAWINQLAAKMVNGAYTSAAGKIRCINIRFEGLWDTVPHIGVFHGGEKDYDFSIPPIVKYAVHANALNEHRGWPADFDGRSIKTTPDEKNSENRIELGFLGSHADIGGGFGKGDLSDVALMWMINQAETQGIFFVNDVIKKEGWDVVTNPLLHDKVSILEGNLPWITDRDYIYGNGTEINQKDVISGVLQYQETLKYIKFYNDENRTETEQKDDKKNNVVAEVNMEEYLKWLSTNKEKGYCVSSCEKK